ncbi:hypothetical protein [Streptomyces sp. DH12]|uniref:hypothetical protein n=1 Tax=Streptomyces sp. DH12 TaxID=2857010 RepID=UPI001E38E260|nr:hypothetical protein [Streptomyces sp. DH12]
MKETGDVRIDSVPLGVTEATGRVRAVAGGLLSLRTAGRLEVHERAAFLAGVRAPVDTLDLPPGAHAAPAPGGGFVVAEAARVRALAPGGATRWELPHDTWHGGHRPPRAPGAPAPDPCGRLVAVTVPTLLPEEEVARRAVALQDGPPRRGYGGDRLLLLDAGTGTVRAERPVAAVAGALALEWHAGGALLAASFRTAWYGWAGYWTEPSDDGLRILGAAADRHEVAGFVPGSARFVTLRRAEGMALDDDRYELDLHDARAATTPCPVASLDLNDLSWDVENDDFTGAHVLDGAHLLVTADWVPREGPLEHTHWLLSADALRPLGRLRYPCPVGDTVVPLGDGTWLTRDGARLRHWRLDQAFAAPAPPPRPGPVSGERAD